MADALKPALTPDEWRVVQFSRGVLLPLSFADGYRDVDLEAIDANSRHRIAALCLYGQPFGFTREDVEELRQMAEVFRAVTVSPPPRFDTGTATTAAQVGDFLLRRRVVVFDSLADRIAALLPPENTGWVIDSKASFRVEITRRGSHPPPGEAQP